MTDDLAKHLVLEHRSRNTDFISFPDTSLSNCGEGRAADWNAARGARRPHLVNARLPSSLNDPLLNLVTKISAVRSTSSHPRNSSGVVRPRLYEDREREEESFRDEWMPTRPIVSKVVNEEDGNQALIEKIDENEKILLKAVFEEGEKFDNKEGESRRDYVQDIILSSLQL